VVDPSGYKLDDRSARWIEGFARLKPGVPLARAQREVAEMAARLEIEYPNEDRGRGVLLLPLWRAPFDGAKELLPMLRVASIVAAFVLLIACANVANLLLVRSFSRAHEMTVRLAIGAGRDRLLRQLITESLILAALATIVGVAVAYWSRHLLSHFFGSNGGIAISFSADLDWRVMIVGVAIGLGSTVLFGLVPAFQGSSVDLAGALKSDARANVGGSGARARIRSSLVIVQVGSSFVLLVGAALLLTSLRRLQMETPGFSTENVLTTAVNLFASRYDTVRAKQFDRELLARVRALPGVEAAAFARSTPFSTRPYDRGAVAVDTYRPARDERPLADYEQVTPGYFATLGIPLVSGRDFTLADEDTTAPVAIVSEAMAARYWRHTSPLGTRLQLDGRWMRVIGVARDIKHRSMLEPAQPIVYVPLTQRFSTVVGLFIRTSQGVGALAPALVREIHALDPTVAPYEILPMREQVARSTTPRRIAVILVGLLGCLALLLAAVGLYGMVSYSVSQSTRELGLRVALGAAPIRVMGFVLSWGLRLIGIGLLLGILVAAGTTRLFGDLLYRVSPLDPRSFAIAIVTLGVTALAACAVPALRAARLDAMRSLRS
jgi:predicted permease